MGCRDSLTPRVDSWSEKTKKHEINMYMRLVCCVILQSMLVDPASKAEGLPVSDHVPNYSDTECFVLRASCFVLPAL